MRAQQLFSSFLSSFFCNRGSFFSFSGSFFVATAYTTAPTRCGSLCFVRFLIDFLSLTFFKTFLHS